MVATKRPNRRKPTKELDFITSEEGRAILDREARAWLGMSGEEFAARWAAGTIEDPDGPGVIGVAMLLPFAR